MSSLPPGTTPGSYEIRSVLGVGGMGEVYRATDTRLGRDVAVAVKVLPANVASNPDRLARFEREARAVASLNHPNIIVLYSIEETDDIRFLTMELVEGKTLDLLIESGGLSVTRALEIGSALAEALVAAHERGIVHRDLKPSNVMITRDGRVKVLDFGLAKQSVDQLLRVRTIRGGRRCLRRADADRRAGVCLSGCGSVCVAQRHRSRVRMAGARLRTTGFGAAVAQARLDSALPSRGFSMESAVAQDAAGRLTTDSTTTFTKITTTECIGSNAVQLTNSPT